MDRCAIRFLETTSKYGQFVPRGWSVYFLTNEGQAIPVCAWKSAAQAVQAAIFMNDLIGVKDPTEINSGIEL